MPDEPVLCANPDSRVINPRLGGCGCQYDAADRLFVDHCVCPAAAVERPRED